MIRSLALAFILSMVAPLARADDPAALARALVAVQAKDWPRATAEARASGALAGDIIAWHRLRAGEGKFAEYADFLTRRDDWPGIPLLRKAGEASLAGQASAAEVRAYFVPLAPQTGAGALALIASLKAGGADLQAEAEAVRAWRSLPFSASDEAKLLAAYPKALGEHHGGRIANALDEGRLAEAKRMLALVPDGTRQVAQARIGLQEKADGVDALIAAVPARMAGSAGLALDRFNWRIAKDRYDDAAALMLERSDSAESLGRPELWSDWRRTLARRAMRAGDGQLAYRLASRHRLSEGDDLADLEWLSGYIALRKLGDAETALAHFRRFGGLVSGPISLSRAGYWEGRALEALKRPTEAKTAYTRAAGYQTAFYGLLAAEKVGLPLDPGLAGRETYPDWRKFAFANSTVLKAAVLLRDAGDRQLAARFVLHLGEGQDGEALGALAGLALDMGEARMALLLAKAAADKGRVWPRAYFPLSGLEKLDLPVAPELALAIARRESEFDPSAISHAGARGLMQLMPGTAKLMAPKIGETYDAGRLLTDPGYNARLGAAYLAELKAEFGASPVLMAAGYNAGPGRPRRWMGEFGDPRSDGTDVVDWIEHIPFRETQNYVMRVAESLPVYRARLTGKVGPLRLSEELKGR